MSNCGLIDTIGYVKFLSNANFSDSAYYSIDDVSIRLIKKHSTDSIHKSNYHHKYNLPGTVHPKLSSISRIDTSDLTGIQIKLWTEVLIDDEHTFYGYAPQLGLLHKLADIDVYIRSDEYRIDLSEHLYGDSTITNPKWENLDFKKTPYTWGSIPYFRDLDSLQNALNQSPNILGRIPDNDYILWLEDFDFMEELSFPSTLILEFQIEGPLGELSVKRDSVIILQPSK